MEALLKKKWFIPSAVVAMIAAVVLLVWSFFYVDYTSIKTAKVITPPFEGTRFGMTMEEFCEAMDITEDELTPAAPLDISRYFNVEQATLDYGMTEDEIRVWEKFKNQYYLRYEEPVYGTENYYMDDQPLTLRIVFTNETTYQDKTIPPLLCAVFVEFPLEGSEYLLNTAIDAIKEDCSSQLEKRWVHEKAQLLSYLYSSGMKPEEIEALGVPYMSQEEVSDLTNQILNSIPLSIIPEQFILNKWYTWNESAMPNGYVVYAQAGYIIYYDWFLNELT